MAIVIYWYAGLYVHLLKVVRMKMHRMTKLA